MVLSDSQALHTVFFIMFCALAVLIHYRLFLIPIIVFFITKVLLFYIVSKVFVSTKLLVYQLKTCTADTAVNILAVDALRLIVIIYLIALYFIIFYNDFSTSLFIYYVVFSYSIPIILFVFKIFFFLYWLVKWNKFQLFALLSLFHLQIYLKVIRRRKLNRKLRRFKYYYIIIFILQFIDFFTIL